MRPYLIQHLLENSCDRYAEKVCVYDECNALTYEGVYDGSREVTHMLQSLDIRKGERVGIFLNKCVEQVLSIFGTLYAGGSFVVINAILKKEQISQIVRDGNIRTIISSHEKVGVNSGTFIKCGVKNIIVFGGRNGYGFEREILFSGSFKKDCPAPLKLGAKTDDISHIIYTSGSTGLPKGIVLSHRNVIDGAKIVSGYTGLGSEDKMIGVLPLNFDYGLNQMMNSVYVGATLYLHNFFLPNDLLKSLEEERVTVFAGMTPIWTKIFNPRLTDLSKKYDFSNLRIITNTGSKVPVPIVKNLQRIFPEAKIFLMYGLTEAFRSTFLDPDEINRRPDSIGKAIPNVEILVLGEDGRECETNEEGELVHLGALVSKGYWNDAKGTGEVFRPNPLLDEENAHLETVVFSGDIVKKDKEGFLYYIGRKDEMIKTKGYRVSPAEVEELILSIDGVSECVASGYEEDGEILLRTFVHLSDDALTEDGILRHCKKHFPFYLAPDSIVTVECFPVTANGKVDRGRIIKEYGDD